MAKYGVMACLKVMVAMKTVSESLTEGQTCNYVCSMVKDEVTRGDAAAIHKFLLNCCASSILEQVESCIRMERKVLGPPAVKCYSCSRRLVSYLTTSVKLYTWRYEVQGKSCFAVQRMQFDLQSDTIWQQTHTWISVLSQAATSCWSHRHSLFWEEFAGMAVLSGVSIRTKADKDPGLVYACLVF